MVPPSKQQGAFIASLVPRITMLAAESVHSKSPYRAKFQAQYDRSYSDLVSSQKRSPKTWY